MTLLVVHLHAADSDGKDFAFAQSTDGRHVSRLGAAAAALLPRPQRSGDEVVALVPATQLSWHRVALPKGIGGTRLRQALAGLLEEQVLDDVAQLHFALEPNVKAGASGWVAVCNLDWLHAQLQQLQHAGLRVTRIVPEFTPEDPAALHALQDHSAAQHAPPSPQLWITSATRGVGVAPLSADAIQALPTEWAASAALYAEASVAAVAEQTLGRAPQLQSAGERWLAATHTRWDLAQFALTQQGGAQRWRALVRLGQQLLRAPAWRAARWGTALLVVVNLLALNTAAWHERQTIAALQDEAQAVLIQTFPQVPVVVDAPLQMAQQVAALRGVSGQLAAHDLEPMLAALGDALSPQQASALTRLDYTDRVLRVRGIDPADAKLRDPLAAKGYSLTPEGDALLLRASGGAP